MAEAGVKLEDSWKRVLSGEFASPYMLKLKEFLLAERPPASASSPGVRNISGRWTSRLSMRSRSSF